MKKLQAYDCPLRNDHSLQKSLCRVFREFGSLSSSSAKALDPTVLLRNDQSMRELSLYGADSIRADFGELMAGLKNSKDDSNGPELGSTNLTTAQHLGG